MTRHPARALLAFSLPLLAAVAARAADEKVKQSEQLKEIVIEGVPRIEIKGDKPAYVPELNPTEPIKDYLAKQLSMPDQSAKMTLALPNYLPSELASDISLTPWHRYLAESPILELVVKRSEIAAVSSWRLVITDDQGTVFRKIQGKKQVPERLSWDGRSGSGQMLKVGRPYAYSLFLLDKAKVPTYLAGKTVLVNGWVDEDGDKVVIAINTAFLFEKGVRFSPKGLAALREAQDRLRKAFAGTIRVNVYGADLDLAQKQAEEIQQVLRKSLHLEPGQVTAQGHPATKSQYPRTEISTR